jgi:ribosomal protein S24E
MDFKVTGKKENALLERTEVNAEISFDGATPSTKEMREMAVQKLGCNPDLMVISSAAPRFGETKMSLILNVYKAPEQLKRVEEAHVLKKNGVAQEEEKKAEAEEGAKESKGEEKPKEPEKKEEAPKEEKPKEAPKEEPKKEEAPKEEPKKEEAPKGEKKE